MFNSKTLLNVSPCQKLLSLKLKTPLALCVQNVRFTVMLEIKIIILIVLHKQLGKLHWLLRKIIYYCPATHCMLYLNKVSQSNVSIYLDERL